MDAKRFRLIRAAALYNIAARKAGRSDRVRLPVRKGDFLRFESVEDFMWYLRQATDPDTEVGGPTGNQAI